MGPDGAEDSAATEGRNGGRVASAADGPGGVRSRILGAAAAALLVATVAFYAASRLGLAGNGAPPEPVDLRAWSLIGCYDLRVDPWADRAPGTGEAPRPGANDGRLPGEGAGVPAPTAASRDPPGRVMLLPDSVDLWGRVLPTHRAVALRAREPPGRSLRWMVRGDTLWILWSDEGTRAGVALSRAGDSLVGSARALSAGDSVDVVARASAFPINCHTGRREPLGGRRVR